MTHKLVEYVPMQGMGIEYGVYQFIPSINMMTGIIDEAIGAYKLITNPNNWLKHVGLYTKLQYQ